MKLIEKKSWGICGITVEINPIEQYEVSRMIGILESYLNVVDTYYAEGGPVPEAPIGELTMLLNFLHKIGLKEECQSTIFEPQEEKRKEKES